MKKEELFQTRIDLIIDYISQILVYGSNTTGNINLNKNTFDDGDYLILTVNVLKNSYFRWHDLGIRYENSISFYQKLYRKIVKKFSTFDMTIRNTEIIISSKVNNNKIEIGFVVDSKDHKAWTTWINKNYTK